MYDVPRSLQSWVSTIQTVVLTADVFQLFIKNRKKIVRTTDHQVPTKKIKYVFQWKIKSNNPHVSYIHMISHEYEYFGSARTPVTKSSTRYHTESLFCFIQDRSIPRSLQRWVSIKSSISQLTFFYFMIIAIEKPYTTARILENEERVLSLPTAISCAWQPQYQYWHACSRWLPSLARSTGEGPE